MGVNKSLTCILPIIKVCTTFSYCEHKASNVLWSILFIAHMLHPCGANKQRTVDSGHILSPQGKETITWLEPEMIAKIKFSEWTEDHQSKLASFKGQRMDQNPRNIKKEKTTSFINY